MDLLRYATGFGTWKKNNQENYKISVELTEEELMEIHWLTQQMNAIRRGWITNLMREWGMGYFVSNQQEVEDLLVKAKKLGTGLDGLYDVYKKDDPRLEDTRKEFLSKTDELSDRFKTLGEGLDDKMLVDYLNRGRDEKLTLEQHEKLYKERVDAISNQFVLEMDEEDKQDAEAHEKSQESPKYKG